MSAPIHSVSWPSGSATYRNQTVGPQHDPYGRDIVDIRIGEKKFSLISCGLAGEWLEDENGKELARLNDDIFADRKAAYAKWDADVEKITGFTARFWEQVLPNRVYEHRWKSDPEGMELQAAAEAAYAGYM